MTTATTQLESKPKRIVTVFQPHRFTRTQLCWKEFLTCFEGSDELILLPIYSAGETAIAGVTSEALVHEIHGHKSQSRGIHATAVNSLEAAAEAVLARIQPGDWVLTLGAGSVTRLAGMLAERLRSRSGH
jgi:UDP-N-acetylmuramate--alanine ligase